MPATRIRTDESRRTPDLEPGITRLELEGGPDGLYPLVADAVLTATGPAYWVDAANQARTKRLYAASADRLTLARLRVARAFTAYQHRTLVADLASRVDDATALVVCSAMPALYADDDLLAGEGRELFRASAKTLLRLRRRCDVPTLVTHAADAPFADLLDACADRALTATATDCGVRYAGDGFETPGYGTRGGAQATLDAFDERREVPASERRPERSVEV